MPEYSLSERISAPAPESSTCEVLFPGECEIATATIEREAPTPISSAREHRMIARQVEYYLGRLCAGRALMALGSSQLFVQRDKGGAPKWPEGFVGSITHCDRFVAAAAARRQDFSAIGIDVEALLTVDSKEAVESTCLNSRELALKQACALSEFEFLTLAFSAKEALFKLISPGLNRFVDFDAVEVAAISAPAGELVLSSTRRLAMEDSIQQHYVGNFCFFRAHVFTSFALSA